jgi:hypothetical protein
LFLFFTLFKNNFRYRKIEEARFGKYVIPTSSSLLQLENDNSTAVTLPFSFSLKGNDKFPKVEHVLSEISRESLKIENSTKESLNSNTILKEDSQILEKKSLVKRNINKISKIHTYTIARPLINMRSLMQISKTKSKSNTRLTKTKSLSIIRSKKIPNEKTHPLVDKASSVLQITQKFLNENSMVSLETLKRSTSKSQISIFKSASKDKIVRNCKVRNEAIEIEDSEFLKSAKNARINDVTENISKKNAESKATDKISKKSLFKSETKNFKIELNLSWEDENNSNDNKNQDSKHSLSTLFSTSTLLDKENAVKASIGENSESETEFLGKNKKPAFNTNIEGIEKTPDVFLLESSAGSSLNSSLKSLIQMAERKNSNFGLTSSNVNLDKTLSKSAL